MTDRIKRIGINSTSASLNQFTRAVVQFVLANITCKNHIKNTEFLNNFSLIICNWFQSDWTVYTIFKAVSKEMTTGPEAPKSDMPWVSIWITKSKVVKLHTQVCCVNMKGARENQPLPGAQRVVVCEVVDSSE